ncbi:MAG: GtrA family protein [Eubacterium sp.]|jgi:putative flippase GtrA|nr:GtrA family protein [Eubacterium sp.]
MTTKKEETMRVIKFTLFSISAGVIQMLAFALLTELTPLPYWPRYLTALILSVLWNFTLNREFTFKAANNIPIAMIKVAVFYMIFTPATTIGGSYLVETLGWNDYLVTALNMLLNFVTEYLYDRFIVFGKEINTKEK